MAVTGNAVAVEFRVDGQDQLNAALKSVKTQIGEVTEAAKAQAAAEEALAAAQAEMAAKQKAQVGMLKSLAGAGQQWTGALKSSAEGLGLVSEGLSKSLGILGPWGAAAGAALGVVTALWTKLSKPDDTKPSEDQLARLTEAYKKLGSAATLAKAEMMLQAEDAEKRSAEELVRSEQQIRSLEAEYEQRSRALAKAQDDIAAAGSEYLQRLAEDNAVAIASEVDGIKAKIDELRGYVATQKKAMSDEEQRQQQAEDEATDAAIRRQTIIDQNREDNAKREAARRQAEADAQKAQQDAEQARQRAIQSRQQQEQKLAAMIAEADKAEVAATGDALEAVKHEYAVKRAQAEKDFADAKLRAKALEQIERQRIVAVAKAEEDAQKKRDDLTKRAAGVTVSRSGPETEVGKVEQQWDQMRSKIVSESQQIAALMAEYEMQYTAEELESSTEYINLKNKQKDAVTALDEETQKYYARLAKAREDDKKKDEEATEEAIEARYGLTEAQKKAVKALDDGFSKMGEHADQFGAASQAITVAQMVASAVKAGADAIEYGAKSIAFFASGNPVAGAGMAAAAAGESAAAAAYIKGIADLGGSAPSQPSAGSAAASGGASAMTGSSGSGEDRDLTVNFSFEGSDHQIAGAIIRGMNMSSAQLGSQKLRKNVISSRR